MFLGEKRVILVELLLELRIVVIQNSEDGKRSVCKKCARKIVNYYRTFTEFREALAGCWALRVDGVKGSAPRIPSRASRRGSIPVRTQRSCNWSDSKGEAPKKKPALVKMKLKELCKDLQQRELCFFDLYSKLDDEITRLMNISTEDNL